MTLAIRQWRTLITEKETMWVPQLRAPSVHPDHKAGEQKADRKAGRRTCLEFSPIPKVRLGHGDCREARVLEFARQSAREERNAQREKSKDL